MLLVRIVPVLLGSALASAILLFSALYSLAAAQDDLYPDSSDTRVFCYCGSQPPLGSPFPGDGWSMSPGGNHCKGAQLPPVPLAVPPGMCSGCVYQREVSGDGGHQGIEFLFTPCEYEIQHIFNCRPCSPRYPGNPTRCAPETAWNCKTESICLEQVTEGGVPVWRDFGMKCANP